MTRNSLQAVCIIGLLIGGAGCLMRERPGGTVYVEEHGNSQSNRGENPPGRAEGHEGEQHGDHGGGHGNEGHGNGNGHGPG
jgi:hypothetical protein